MFENVPLELYSARYPPYLKLWRTFYTPIPFQNVRFKVVGVSLLIITWVSALFSFQLNFRPAAATPGYVILFYPGRRETCHEKPYGKSKVHYLIFIA